MSLILEIQFPPETPLSRACVEICQYAMVHGLVCKASYAGVWLIVGIDDDPCALAEAFFVAAANGCGAARSNRSLSDRLILETEGVVSRTLPLLSAPAGSA